jgi:LmbE family N-acetylglucosaminyl deacetylase
LRQRWEVAYWIRRFRPDVVLGHDPWRPYRIHPDHRHAGLLACEGIVAARDPKFFPEQHVAPHRPELLLLWEAAVVHHVEDISGFVDTKLRALLAHESQLETTMRISRDPDPSMVDAFRDRIVTSARNAGRPAGMEAGEAFAAIRRL